LILKNASLYDPYWSVIPPLLLLCSALYMNVLFELPIMFMMLSISVWGIRLTYNWASLWDGFHHMDWRYERIKRVSPKLYPLTNLLAIQLFPTLIVFAQLIGAVYVIETGVSFNVYVLFGGF